MKALSLWQPYASAVALKLKKIETRSWRTNFLGEIAICASQKKSATMREFFDTVTGGYTAVSIAFSNEMLIHFDQLPFGAVGDIEFWSDSKAVGKVERLFGDYSPGRYGWVLDQVERLRKPVPVIGRQGIFNLPDDVEQKVRAQLI